MVAVGFKVIYGASEKFLCDLSEAVRASTHPSGGLGQETTDLRYNQRDFMEFYPFQVTPIFLDHSRHSSGDSSRLLNCSLTISEETSARLGSSRW